LQDADVFLRLLALTIATLTVLSTLYDVFTRQFQLKSNDVFKTFSIVGNSEQLMKINESESVIHSIHGIKAISGDMNSKIPLSCL
jgi:hypothetical protein